MIKNNDHTFAVLLYKNSLHLEECISSLLGQKTLGKILLVTSTPTGVQKAIAKKYKIPLMINKEHANIASDWDFAYKICDTSFVTLTHQDDIYLEDYLNECLKFLSKEPKTSILFTDYYEMRNNENIKIFNFKRCVKLLLLIQYIFISSYKTRFWKTLPLRFGNPITCPSVVFNKRLIGDFNFVKEYKYVLDWEAWYRIARINGSFGYINKRLLIHRVHKEASTFHMYSRGDCSLEEELMFRKLLPKWLASLWMKIYKFNLNSLKKL